MKYTFKISVYLLFIVFLMSAVFSAEAQTRTRGLTVVPKVRRHAVLIGINAYPSPVSPLNFCVKDMTDLAEQLEKCGFPKENIRLMVDSSKGDLKPTGANIRSQITKITEQLEENDFLFVAFSGHGVLIDGKSYLCPIDLDTGKVESFVDREALFRTLDDCSASRKIFLCDACRNEFQIKGTGGRSLLKARTLNDPMSTDLHGFILMSSCAEKQQSIEYSRLGNGVFTHFLLEGLRGAAANEKGYISVMRLFAHANDKTINFTRGQQTPMFRPGGETSDFIIARIDRPAVRPELPKIRIDDISGKISWGKIEIPPAEEIVVEDLVLPPVPEEITRTRIEIQLIQEAVRQLQAGTHPVLQQLQEALAQAKAVQDQAEANWLEVDVSRKESWAELPQSTQTALLERIMKKPDLKVSSVRDLCPEELSFVDFAKMVSEGKRVAPVLAEYRRVKAEYEKLSASAATMKEQALKDLLQQAEEKEEKNKNMVAEFKQSVLLKLLSECSGFDDINAEFPFDDLISRIPALERYEFGWQEKDLFDDAETVWGTRPCIVKVRGLAGARKVLTADGIEYVFRRCPAGTFTMGSPSSEPGRYSNEGPQHKVTLTRGFWMLETEVTQAMWESVMGTSIQTQASKGTSRSLKGTGADYPIYYVDWEESRTFCEKLSSKLGVQVSLPTEAQWEYACRAGTTGVYAGDLDKMGWYWNNSGEKTHPVGQKKPNAWGLYDMHGNVWEWCSDRYGKDYYSESPTSDPTGLNSGSFRVNRGGSWGNNAEDCRSASRNFNGPGNRDYGLGFRIVLADPAPEN